MFLQVSASHLRNVCCLNLAFGPCLKHGERNVNCFRISALKIAVINLNRVHRQLV